VLYRNFGRRLPHSRARARTHARLLEQSGFTVVQLFYLSGW
jgi:hypothetical protein